MDSSFRWNDESTGMTDQESFVPSSRRKPGPISPHRPHDSQIRAPKPMDSSFRWNDESTGMTDQESFCAVILANAGIHFPSLPA